MHPNSRKYLRFVAFWEGVSVQSPLFCTLHGSAVFTRVMGPVSSFLHRSGIGLRRDLDNWLLQASSREQVLLALDMVPHLCHLLGIVVSWEKSQLVPTQRMGVSGSFPGLCLFQGLPEQGREASLNWLRILVLGRVASVILARALRSAVFNDSARPGRASSDVVSAIGPSACLGPLQSVGSCQWDFGDSSRSGVAADSISTESRDFSRSGVPTARLVVRCLGRRLGSHLGEEFASGLWSLEEAELSLTTRGLLAM